MEILFFSAAIIAVIATVFVITRLNAVHALLYLIVSLLAIAVVFFTLGAPFVSALEVIIYAGAIMVLFVFVIMMFTLGAEHKQREAVLFSPYIWVGPAVLGILLLAEISYFLLPAHRGSLGTLGIGPRQVGMLLYGPYILAVEIASFLLLAGLVSAYHLGRRQRSLCEELEEKT